ITLRQLESLVRLAEARAKAALRSEVTVEDAEAAIMLVKRCLEETGMDLSTFKVDVDLIMTGKPKSLRDMLTTIVDIVAELEKETGLAEERVVREEALRRGMPEPEYERGIAQLLREGTLFVPRQGYLKKT
ncbi:MAG: Minichromosome maintenance protein MCM, partial [Candidatus Bathyarchaeia archaeon]